MGGAIRKSYTKILQEHIEAHRKQMELEELEDLKKFTVNDWIANIKDIEENGTGVFIEESFRKQIPNLMEAEKVYNSKLYKVLK